MSQSKTKRDALNQPKLIQLIHIGKSKLCLDDDTYRSLLVAMTGKDSTKAMTASELNKVLARLKQLGFVVAHKKKDPKPIDDKVSLDTEQQIKLIRHLFGLNCTHWERSETAVSRLWRLISKIKPTPPLKI